MSGQTIGGDKGKIRLDTSLMKEGESIIIRVMVRKTIPKHGTRTGWAKQDLAIMIGDPPRIYLQ